MIHDGIPENDKKKKLKKKFHLADKEITRILKSLEE
jgi:hypothetical protein